MQWSDEGIVLSVRPHGETAAIAWLFTRAHGRHGGIVHGGRSRQRRPILQTGNQVTVDWKARLEDSLGAFTVELERGFAAESMADVGDGGRRLSALMTVASLLNVLPERDPHPSLYEVTLFLLSFLDQPGVWPALYVRWELMLLAELGAGLDLSRCASSGETRELIYVSPRSGRAVSRAAGEPYKDKLLPLPEFLRPGRSDGAVPDDDVRDGLALTGFFLEARVLRGLGLDLPSERRRIGPAAA